MCRPFSFSVFTGRLPVMHTLRIKKSFNKNRYFIFHISNLNVGVLDSPTHLRQFDANCGKIRYVSDP